MPRNPEKGHSALRRRRASLPQHIYNITVVTLERKPWFHNFDAAAKVSACFSQQALLGNSTMMAWVLMPDHAHWLIQLGEHDELSLVVSRLKAASARAANQALSRKGQLWQRSYHDHALRDDEDLKTVARYIVGNPVRAGLVEHVGQYPYWNAVWL
ncbi:MAG: transposase [Pseudomonadota bacterium]